MLLHLRGRSMLAPQQRWLKSLQHSCGNGNRLVQRPTSVSFLEEPVMEGSASVRRAIVEVAKEAGKKLLTGNFNLINLSMPVKMSEPRSYLQKLTDVWVYPR